MGAYALRRTARNAYVLILETIYLSWRTPTNNTTTVCNCELKGVYYSHQRETANTTPQTINVILHKYSSVTKKKLVFGYYMSVFYHKIKSSLCY